MAKKKGRIDEIIESKQAPGVMGSKKKYFVDHKVIWDGSAGPRDPKTRKPTGAALVVAEKFENGRRVIETRDTELQEKLEKRGYKAEADNKLMHTAGQAKVYPDCSIKSADQVEAENK